MAFINPGLLGLIALGAVPIIIHLLMKRRFRIIIWAAMEFLLASVEQNRRRLQLRDLILMLIRTAAVIFLALALARPSITSGAAGLLGGRGTVAAAIILDNSYSMGYHTGREERFEIAKRMARTIVSSLSKGSRVSIVFFSDVADLEIPRPVHDLGTAERSVTGAPLSDGATDVAVGMEAGWKTLSESGGSSREVYLITDLQENAWPEPTNKEFGEKLRGMAEESRLFILNVGDGRSDNLAVTDMKLDDEFASTDMPVSFTVTARNFGEAAQSGIPVDLYVDERKAATRTVDVGPNESAQVSVATRFTQGGDHKVRVQLGVDRLLADNDRFLSLDVLEEIRVLVIDGQPSDAPAGFKGESSFLKMALSPVDYTDPESKTLITCDVVNPLSAGERNYSDYHAVVLANVADIPSGRVERLRRFVASGGGLLIFPGDQVEPDRYNATFGAGGESLLPCSLGAAAGDAESRDRGVSFSTEALDHPIVAYFGIPENRPYMSSPKFYRAFGLSAPANGGADGLAVVARFEDGRPAIVERKIGLGRVVLFASTADIAWNNFAMMPAYLPVMRRTIEYVTAGARAQRNIDVHTPIRATVDLKDANVRCTVLGPRGGRRSVEPTPMQEWAEILLAETPFRGFYGLTIEKAPPQELVFAANCNTKESRLEQIDEAELRKRYPNVKFTFVSASDDLKSIITSERVGVEIWPYLLALIFALLLAESYLAARWAPKE